MNAMESEFAAPCAMLLDDGAQEKERMRAKYVLNGRHVDDNDKANQFLCVSRLLKEINATIE